MYKTIKNLIETFEDQNPDQAMVVVINSSPASELRQIAIHGGECKISTTYIQGVLYAEITLNGKLMDSRGFGMYTI